jgi:hypothetical protein
MSEATRSIALQEAVKASGNDLKNIIAVAEQFHQFIIIDSLLKPTTAQPGAEPAKPASPSKPAATKTAPAAAKPAVTKAVPAKAPAKSEEDVVDAATSGPTQAEVKKAIISLIAADKRDAAIAILDEYGAKSVGGLAAESYADVVDAVNAALADESLTG